jgi:diguanylate cyclase (GGDEF)-like protein
MLLVLLLLVSIANIALAFHTTLAFRRDRVLIRAREAARARCEIDLETLDDMATDEMATDDMETDETVEPAPGDLPAPDPAEESEVLSDSPAVTGGDIPAQPVIPPLNAAEQPPLKELFYRAARLVGELAQIDHCVLACQADQQATDEKLGSMWPELATKGIPVEELLMQVAESDDPAAIETYAELQARGLSIVEHCRALAEEMDSVAKREDHCESGIHHLRDLFTKACEFRDLCEDLTVDQLATDHRLYAEAGRIALQAKLTELACEAGEVPHRVIGLAIDHVRELNSMYGAAAVSALLDELPQCIMQQVPETVLVSRYHGQRFLVLVPGDDEQVANLADRLRQQVESTTFRTEGSTIEITLSAAITPPTLAASELLSQVAAGMATAKAHGPNCVVVNHEEQWEKHAGEAEQTAPCEIALEV